MSNDEDLADIREFLEPRLKEGVFEKWLNAPMPWGKEYHSPINLIELGKGKEVLIKLKEAFNWDLTG